MTGRQVSDPDRSGPERHDGTKLRGDRRQVGEDAPGDLSQIETDVAQQVAFDAVDVFDGATIWMPRSERAPAPVTPERHSAARARAIVVRSAEEEATRSHRLPGVSGRLA